MHDEDCPYESTDSPEMIQERISYLFPTPLDFIEIDHVWWNREIDEIGGGWYFYPVSADEISSYFSIEQELDRNAAYRPWHKQSWNTRLCIDESVVPPHLIKALDNHYDSRLNDCFSQDSFNPWGDNLYTVDGFKKVRSDFKRMSASDSWCEGVCLCFDRIVEITKALNKATKRNNFLICLTGP